ncbi:hypothetical protein [Desulfosarcina alkanivorans]|uniref:hypothetical protein n=1 Tax=Desulfosarcina alkanivorans TaxID=571177 RepID=UPI0012D2DD5C|nr:hypothetical protein [Desulfosarcina alkanivorans]
MKPGTMYTAGCSDPAVFYEVPLFMDTLAVPSPGAIPDRCVVRRPNRVAIVALSTRRSGCPAISASHPISEQGRHAARHPGDKQ